MVGVGTAELDPVAHIFPIAASAACLDCKRVTGPGVTGVTGVFS